MYTTYGEFVLSSQPTEMMDCSHKEADTRLLLQAYYPSQSGYCKILIRTVDTGRGKTSAWDVWNVLPQITATFSMLASVPKEIPEQEFIAEQAPKRQ